MKKIIIIIILIGLGGLTASAQIPQPDPDTTARHFLIVASIGNLQEVSAGELAVQNAKHPDVKSFGQMMVTDHNDAEQKLLQLAKTKDYTLPPASTGGIRPDLNLKNAGNKFDAMYIHDMLAAHGNTLQTFQTYATTGKDPDVRAFAEQMLPTLKAHLESVKTLDEKYKELTSK